MRPLIHAFTVLDKCYVYDANANSILLINKDDYEIAKSIECGISSEEGHRLIDKFNKQGYFLFPQIKEIKHPETDTLKYHVGRKLQKLTLQVTQDCNLRCEYCMYSGLYETRTHDQKTMDFSIAKKAINYVLEHSIEEPDINFSFYGGEPLLELDFIEKCVSYIHGRGSGKNLSFNMTTNGTLLTPNIYKRLTENNINILISLDGPKVIHDSSRKYPDGRGSFDDIMNNISDIQSKFPEAKDKLLFLAVVSPEIEKSCIEQLYTIDDIIPYYGVQMSLVSDYYAEKQISYSADFVSVHTQEKTKLLLNMLGKLGEKHVSELLLAEKSNLELKNDQLKRMSKLPPKCHPGGPCLAGVQRLFVSVDGVFYPCERVSETSLPMQIGNVDDGIDVEKANCINNIGKLTEDECKACWAFSHCTQCAAVADNLTEFSKEKRLAKCDNVRWQVESMFKEICFLKSYGYDFNS